MTTPIILHVNPADRDMISGFLLNPTTQQDEVYIKKSAVLRLLDEAIRLKKIEYIEAQRDWSPGTASQAAEIHNALLCQRRTIGNMK